MMRFSVSAAFCSVLLLAACHRDPNEVDRQKFKQALNEHYARRCITVGEGTSREQFPLTLALSAQKRNDPVALRDRKLSAFVDTGLLSVQDQPAPVQASSQTPSEKPDHEVTHRRTYSLTKIGQSLLAYGTYFCAGHYKVSQIKAFTAPGKILDGSVVTSVSYTVSPKEIASWAKNPAVQALWPDLGERLAKDRQRNMTLVQTEKGWAVEDDFND